MTDKPELKLCPFCGSKGEYDQDGEEHPHKPPPNYRIRCSSGECDAATPFDYIFKNVDAAFKAWNTRPAPEIGGEVVDVEVLKTIIAESVYLQEKGREDKDTVYGALVAIDHLHAQGYLSQPKEGYVLVKSEDIRELVARHEYYLESTLESAYNNDKEFVARIRKAAQGDKS